MLDSLLTDSSYQVKHVPAEYCSRRYPVKTLLPPAIARSFHDKRKDHFIFKAYTKADKFFGAQINIVGDNPKEAVKTLLARKNSNSELAYIYNEISNADGIIINGEGEFVFSSLAKRKFTPFFALIIELARQLGKKVWFINGMIADCTETGRSDKYVKMVTEALKKCDAVSVRDPYSLTVLNEVAPDIKATYIPDATFAMFESMQDVGANLPANGDYIIPWQSEDRFFYGKLDFQKPYICIAGGTRAGWMHNREKSIVQYKHLTEQIKKLGLAVYFIVASKADDFLCEVSKSTGCPVIPLTTSLYTAIAILANAKLLISGRYHPLIYASLGGTPCIALETESHKTLSVQTMLEYPQPRVFSYIPTHEESKTIVDLANDMLEQGDGLRNRIKEAAARRAQEVSQLINLLEAS